MGIRISQERAVLSTLEKSCKERQQKFSSEDKAYLERLISHGFLFVSDFYQKDDEKSEWIKVVFSKCKELIQSLIRCDQVGMNEQLALLDVRSRLCELGDKWLTGGGFTVIEQFPSTWVKPLDQILDRVYPAWRTTD